MLGKSSKNVGELVAAFSKLTGLGLEIKEELLGI